VNAFDAATLPLRAMWPGRIELAPVAAAVDSLPPVIAVLPADASDPLAAAVPSERTEPLALTAERSPVRIRRGMATAEDSIWLANTPNAVLLQWPRDTAAVLSADGILGTHGTTAALVAPLARGSLGADTTAVRVIARWRDGVPAATERALGSGCLRDVAVGVPERGDVTLRAPFAALLDVLVEPCGGRRSAAASDALRADLAGDGSLAPASRFTSGAAGSPWTPWLLPAALLALLAEQWWRRRAAAGVA
jgi:hypothetical protein